MAHLHLPLLHFILIIFIQLCYHTHSLTHPQDIQSLQHFLSAIDPSSLTPGSCLSSWNFSLDPCDSLSGTSFTCALRCDLVISGVSRVTDLTLDPAGYSGTLDSIPTSFSLPYLTTLDLTDNSFTGPIPTSFQHLTRLLRLGLSNNRFTGSVPDSLPDSLQELFLDNNNLHGQIPHSLTTLKNLKRLDLQGNQLTGELPDLSQLGNLTFLDISNNAISGYLPSALPPNLIELAVRNNSLQGNIPMNLTRDSIYLQVLDMSYNNLTGALPAEDFTHPSLQQLTLGFNRLRWIETPENWGSDSELIAIDLSNNDIHGLLPEFFGWMPRLSALSLENNKFSGEIPTRYAVRAVAEVGGFERLLLGGNYLFGLIPGPFLRLDSGSGVRVGLGNNCLYECPASFYFCEGGVQKSLMECKTFSPVLP